MRAPAPCVPTWAISLGQEPPKVTPRGGTRFFLWLIHVDSKITRMDLIPGGVGGSEASFQVFFEGFVVFF